jgi:sugar phosphate isomerase/epimerase
MYEPAGFDSVELGYCPDPSIDLRPAIADRSFDVIAHNYFRPIEKEFVLNLASPDDAIRRRSIQYVRSGIDFCNACGIGTYTFHAGFRVDPSPEFNFDADTVPDADDCLDRFVDSLGQILPHADRRGVTVAIENNVVEDHHLVDGEPVVLLADPAEFKTLFDRTDVDVLLDVGHLNVASRTLEYDRDRFVETVAPSVVALHLHTNDGTTDSHGSIGREDWAFDLWRRFDVPATIETYFDDISDIEEQLEVFEDY